jgi:hypothetical protein
LGNSLTGTLPLARQLRREEVSMNFKTRLLRALGLMILGAGTLASVSHVKAETTLWVEASSESGTQSLDLWAGNATKGGLVLIGNLQTAWDGSNYVPINTTRGFHPGGHTFYVASNDPGLDTGEIHRTDYRPYFCNQVVAVYACDQSKCPTGSCLDWAGQHWDCVTWESPSITWVPCTP